MKINLVEKQLRANKQINLSIFDNMIISYEKGKFKVLKH